MTGWRFHPLAEFPRDGVLVSPKREPFVASYFTLAEAKAIAPKGKPTSANTDRLDRFAEHLANGLSVALAAQRVGSTPHHGHTMLGKIRKQLGPQAR